MFYCITLSETVLINLFFGNIGRFIMDRSIENQLGQPSDPEGTPILWSTTDLPDDHQTSRNYSNIQSTNSRASKMSLVPPTGECSTSAIASSSATVAVSTYPVLRDADSTVLDYGSEVVSYYKHPSTSMELRGRVLFEGKLEYLSMWNVSNRRLNKGEIEGKHSVQVLRPHSTPATLLWLEENYEIAEGVCIPRSALYMHYVDFCAKNCIQPVNAASFGKIIRQQFPQLTTRRLGTRGQSRYHYYGIAVRESSAYYQLAYSKRAITSNQSETIKQEAILSSGVKPQQQTSENGNNGRSRTGTVLPEFPNLKYMKLPETLDPVKTTTFLMMYRTHCQRILDTVIRANFEEVQTFVLYFWQGVPPHLSSILSSNAFVNLIGVCDAILYKAIANVLLPSALQTLPESLAKVLRKFGDELDTWLKMALFNVPENLRLIKLDLARRFGQILRRQTSLSHLSQALRMVVNNGDVASQMLHDWRQIDIQGICREIMCTADQLNSNQVSYQLILSSCREFQRLIEEDSSTEGYLQWLDSLVKNCVVNPSLRKRCSVGSLARQFLLLWSAFGSRIIRDMTLHSSPSFGSFHLLRLLFDDYVLYLMEYLQIEEYIKEFLDNVPTDEPPKLDLFFPDGILCGTSTNLIHGNAHQESGDTSLEPCGYGCHSDSVEMEMPTDPQNICEQNVEPIQSLNAPCNSQGVDLYGYTTTTEYYQPQGLYGEEEIMRRYQLSCSFPSCTYEHQSGKLQNGDNIHQEESTNIDPECQESFGANQDNVTYVSREGPPQRGSVAYCSTDYDRY